MNKKLALGLAAIVFLTGASYPSPTFQNLTITGSVTAPAGSIPNAAVAGLGNAALASTGTAGHALAYLDGNNTFSGNNAHSGSETFYGALNLQNAPTGYAGYVSVFSPDGVRRGFFGFGDGASNIVLQPDNGWGLKIVSPTIQNGVVSTNPAAGDNSTKVASTAYVFNALTAYALLGANTFTGKQTLPASTASAAPLNIPQGTAPTSPVNGDIWTTNAGIFVRYNGTTAGPLASAASSGRTLLNTLTASNSATLDDTTSISAMYLNYELQCDRLVPSASTPYLSMLVQQGGAWVTANYGGGNMNYTNNTAPSYANGVTAALNLGYGNATQPIDIAERFNDPLSTSKRFTVTGNVYTGNQMSSTWAYQTTLAANTGFRLAFSTGNMVSGVCRVYGYN